MIFWRRLPFRYRRRSRGNLRKIITSAKVCLMEFHPVTSEQLPDLIRFSEQHGKFGWCSCMRWRQSSSEFKSSEKANRKAALEELVRQGRPVGILGYREGEPVAWCSIAPRESYIALERSRTIPRVDDAPVWSVVCFFIDSKSRKQGYTLALLEAALEYAHAQGAQIVEGYPWPGGASYLYMGTPETFEKAGFHEVVSPGPKNRRVVRYVLA